MSDQEPLQGSDPSGEPSPEAPRRMACPRCRGIFEGSPDFCPHCGLSKSEAATLSSQATITPPLAATSGSPAEAPAPPPVEPAPAPPEFASPAPPVGAAYAPAAEDAPPAPPVGAAPAPPPEYAPATPVTAEVEGSRKTRRPWLLAIPLVAVLAAAVFWWVSNSESEKPAEDACSIFREELLAVQSQEFENSREERRALAEVHGRARKAGCDSDDLRSET